jgi:hypothetical protein
MLVRSCLMICLLQKVNKGEVLKVTLMLFSFSYCLLMGIHNSKPNTIATTTNIGPFLPTLQSPTRSQRLTLQKRSSAIGLHGLETFV